MLTKGEVDFINHIVRQACVYWIAPWDWDTELNLARSAKSKWKRIFCILNVIVGLVFLAFSVSTLHISVSEYRETRRLDGVVIHGILLVINLGLSVFQVTVYLHLDELIWLLNNAVLMNQTLGRAHMRTTFLDSNNREKYTQVFQWIINLEMAATWTVLVVFREHHGNVYSVLPSGYKTGSTFFILCMVECWICLMEVRLTFTILYLVPLTYFRTAIFWLRYIWARDTLASATNAYNSIVILNTVHNKSVCRWFIPIIKFEAGLLSMLCIYIVINLRHQVHPMILLLSGCVILAAYIFLISGSYLMSDVYKYSIKMKLNLTRSLIERIQDGNERKINSMVLNSMAPMKCCVGNLYFMEKQAKGTLVDWLIQGTMTLLLTFKK